MRGEKGFLWHSSYLFDLQCVGRDLSSSWGALLSHPSVEIDSLFLTSFLAKSQVRVTSYPLVVSKPSAVCKPANLTASARVPLVIGVGVSLRSTLPANKSIPFAGAILRKRAIVRFLVPGSFSQPFFFGLILPVRVTNSQGIWYRGRKSTLVPRAQVSQCVGWVSILPYQLSVSQTL